jgi:hypothetical protein
LNEKGGKRGRHERARKEVEGERIYSQAKMEIITHTQQVTITVYQTGASVRTSDDKNTAEKIQLFFWCLLKIKNTSWLAVPISRLTLGWEPASEPLALMAAGGWLSHW